MDVNFNEEQQMLKTTARDFLQKECPSSLVRSMEDDDENRKGLSDELWDKIAGLGWIGMALPEKYDGGGRSFLDLAILLEEMGRAAVLGPFISTVLSGRAIAEAGTEKQKEFFLPRIARGEVTFALAFLEEEGTYDLAAVNTSAKLQQDGYVINGTKMFVDYAEAADYFLCVVKVKNGDQDKGKAGVLLVDAKVKGITFIRLDSIGGERQCEVAFKNVKVAKDSLLGNLRSAPALVDRILMLGAVAESALMAGGAQKAMEMSVEYAKQRTAFEKPIGSFQVIQHKLVDMLCDVEGARFITYEAAWALDRDKPCALEVSAAKAYTSEMYKRVMIDAHQIHGGVGQVWEHDLTMYSRRFGVQQALFGDASFHRERVAQQL